MVRLRWATSVMVVACVLAACGGGGGGESTEEAADDVPRDAGPAESIADREAGPDDYVLSSPVTRGEVVVLADEAQAGLEAVEEHLRTQDPEASADVQCWLMRLDDGTIAQAMRCGPYVDPDGRVTWSSYPFASDDAAESEGRLVLRYESRLIGEVEPFIESVELVRPDGLEAPDDAYSDVVEGSGTAAPEAPTSCTATGTVNDDTYGEFDLDGADLLEVTATVEDSDLDPGSYLHRHTVLSWSDDEGRGVYLQVRITGAPGEEEVESVTIDLDKSNRPIMEGNGPGNPSSIDQADLPTDLVAEYDPATGGTIAAELTIPGRYSYESDNIATTDVTISCE